MSGRYFRDVRLCAKMIFRDMCRWGVPSSVMELVYLSRDFNWPVLLDWCLSEKEVGYFDGESIRLCPTLSGRRYVEAIPHELVHAVASSPRWEWLNWMIEGYRYERERFIEAVARLVGKMFVKALTA